jgi:hypothetical protein
MQYTSQILLLVKNGHSALYLRCTVMDLTCVSNEFCFLFKYRLIRFCHLPLTVTSFFLSSQLKLTIRSEWDISNTMWVCLMCNLWCTCAVTTAPLWVSNLWLLREVAYPNAVLVKLTLDPESVVSGNDLFLSLLHASFTFEETNGPWSHANEWRAPSAV